MEKTMKKMMFVMIATLLVANPVAASSAAPEACKNTVKIEVKGLVCDFCARALEKVFGKRDEVANISVDLSKSLVTVVTKPGAVLDDATLTKLITDSGYNITAIDRGC
jgi:copper chaperone CopZ